MSIRSFFLFSFQTLSDFIDKFVKFSNFMSGGGTFDSLVCPEGRVLYTRIVPGGCCLQVVSGGLSRRGGGVGFG